MFVIERAPTVSRRTDLASVRLLLLVRDSKTALGYQNLFEVFGATVIAVFSAKDLLDTLRTERPDIIACDVDLPHESGLHLIKRVRMRTRLEGGGTPAIGMAESPTPQIHTKALISGFQALSSREPMDLLLAVRDVLGERPSPS